MNTRSLTVLAMALVVGMMGGALNTQARPAPAFSLTDIDGKAHALADYKGRVVVLEWTNPDCPFVKKHYGSGNMQSLQKEFAAKGVVWLTVNSSAPGKQGHYEPSAWKTMLTEKGSAPTAMLLDPDGTAGHAYGAKTTPHLFVINAEGELVYEGAIDDNSSYNPEDIAGAQNYVKAALDAVLGGQPVATAVTQPYGCSVKY